MKSRDDEAGAAAPKVGGVDIGKDVFHLVAFDAAGKVAFCIDPDYNACERHDRRRIVRTARHAS